MWSVACRMQIDAYMWSVACRMRIDAYMWSVACRRRIDDVCLVPDCDRTSKPVVNPMAFTLAPITILTDSFTAFAFQFAFVFTPVCSDAHQCVQMHTSVFRCVSICCAFTCLMLCVRNLSFIIGKWSMLKLDVFKYLNGPNKLVMNASQCSKLNGSNKYHYLCYHYR